jgi:hypothetical protein
METASFKILSPNTKAFKCGSTFNAWKIAKVATGSTADNNEAYIMESKKCNNPNTYNPIPITIVDNNVPKTAKTKILPKLKKKYSLCIL